MKVTLGLIALFGTPAAGAAVTYGQFHEPTVLMLSGVALLAIGTLLRRYA